MIKKFAIQFIVLLVVIFAALYLSFRNFNLVQQSLPEPQKPQEFKKVTIGQTQINVELADSVAKRALGLGQRDNLASDSGMLFVFDKSDNYKFWMKGMRFALDMIFVAGNKVVDLAKNAPVPSLGTADQDLPRFSSSTPFDRVIEVNSGFVDTHGIKVGDTIIGI